MKSGLPNSLAIRKFLTTQYNNYLSHSSKMTLSQQPSTQKNNTKMISLVNSFSTNHQRRSTYSSRRYFNSQRTENKTSTSGFVSTSIGLATLAAGVFWLFGKLKLSGDVTKTAVKKSKSIVIEANNFETIIPYLSNCERDALIMFDVDLTLLAPKDAILHDKNYKIVTSIFQDFENRFGKDHATKLWSILISQRQPRLVDPAIPNAIRQLKERKVKVVALTQCSTGPQGIITSKEMWRFNELLSLDIDFSDSFPGHPVSINLIEPLPGETNSPLYHSGIIFSGNVNKPKALNAFFHRLNYFPKQIIFIDDCLEYLQLIQEFCKTNNIDFLGFHYTAIQSENTPPIDEARMDLQFKTLEKELKWLSDQEADRISDTAKRTLKC